MALLHRRLRYGATSYKELNPLVRLWVLRVLCSLEGYKEFINSRRGFSNDDLARQLGLGEWDDGEDEKAQAGQARLALEKMHRAAEKSARALRLPETLRANIERLGGQVGLSDTEMRILEFAVMINLDPLLDAACDLLGDLDMNKLFHCLSVILALPASEVSAALQARGLLAQSGLLTVEKRNTCSVRSKLDLMSNGFAELMSASALDLPALMRDSIGTAPQAKLTLNDYPYLSPFNARLMAYLKNALASGKAGVNVLLHGKPGTGKSELVRAIARELGSALFEVSSEDEDGDPRDGAKRLRSFRAAQYLFARQKNTLLVFDEIEDIFWGNFFSRSVADKHKAWINRMLETNPVPTLWLSNSIRNLDPAFVRRFDLVHEIPIPPKSTRVDILGKAGGGLLDASAIKRLAESEHLSPAVVARSVAVVKDIQGDLPENPQTVLETLIGDSMAAQRLKRIPREDPARLPDVYDPAFLNTDVNMADLAAGIQRCGAARLCLYGAPGTGKTAFGRWLAEQLDAPLLVKRASDLLSMWLGETEQNIAKAFREAEKEKAVLLIDEADSFLRDRRGAQRSWEVTQVNEMLTQMEAFPGVFIASTNLLGDLDQASLRRFDMKVKFDCLRADQAWELFRRHCAGLGIDAAGASEAEVKALSNLAPGDFAAVIRRHRFHPIQTESDFAQALRGECEVKQGGLRKAIGFV